MISRNKIGVVSLVFGGLALGVVGFASADSSVLSDESSSEPKVIICHATNAEDNPYNTIEVAQSSVDDRGHGDHTGPAWYPGAKDADVAWGDIIPPSDGVTGLNWPAGESTFNNGCELPGATTEKGNKPDAPKITKP